MFNGVLQMMRVTMGIGPDPSPSLLRRYSQLGVDCVDIGEATNLPGVQEQGFPDLDSLLDIKQRVHSWGLRLNRLTLPDVGEDYFLDREGAERYVENSVNALRVFGEAGVPIARQRCEGDTFNHLATHYRSVHRAGMLGSGYTLGHVTPEGLASLTPEDLRAKRVHVWDHTTGRPPTKEQLDNWWQHFVDLYARLVPVAEEYDLKLAMHPSDNPLPDSPFGGLGFHRIIDAFPSPNVGFLYCIGTRAEAGSEPLVLQEINHYGRKGRIFMVHFRNVRGSFATSGGYEEVHLDDGDMNMFHILEALHKVGFDGCINPDHIFQIDGDTEEVSQGAAYSIGYIKALLAALYA